VPGAWIGPPLLPNRASRDTPCLPTLSAFPKECCSHFRLGMPVLPWSPQPSTRLHLPAVAAHSVLLPPYSHNQVPSRATNSFLRSSTLFSQQPHRPRRRPAICSHLLTILLSHNSAFLRLPHLDHMRDVALAPFFVPFPNSTARSGSFILNRVPHAPHQPGFPIDVGALSVPRLGRFSSLPPSPAASSTRPPAKWFPASANPANAEFNLMAPPLLLRLLDALCTHPGIYPPTELLLPPVRAAVVGPLC